MQALPRAARLYILLIIALGSAITLLASSQLWGNWANLLACLALAIIIAVLDHYPVKFPVAGADGGATENTVSTTVKLAALLVWPLPVAVVASFAGTLAADLRMRRSWFKAGFNAGMMSITYLLAGWLYSTVAGHDLALFQSPRNLAALVALGIGELLINSLLVSVIVALVAGMPVFYVWSGNLRPIVLHDVSMIPIGISIAMLYELTPWSILLAVVPILVVRSSYQAIIDLRGQTRQALQALARVLDERDQATAHHSELVSKYAQSIAQDLGLSPMEVDVIVQAAWLHDIGKVGMRDDILYKQGSLDSQERQAARHHAAIGGDLLQKFPSFKQGAIIVRHHHEWWNGMGYPDGLKGEAIPLGARILAVADAYQAMTDIRPYRRPLTQEAALAELQRNAGIQFDPQIVQVFLKGKGFEQVIAPEPQVAADPARVQV